jgi:hypothetical protein
MVNLLGVALLFATAPAGPLWTEGERKVLLDGLSHTRDLVVDATKGLSPAQWRFKEEPGRWSIAEIVEHLGVQDDLYFREMFIISQQPSQPPRRQGVKEQDALILEYTDDPEKSITNWSLEPLGRWAGEPARAVAAFLRTREHLIAFVRDTKKDLRLQLTFRDYKGKGDRWSVRDLHQLMLTNIAHARRHVNQIERVKAHPKYPR